MSPPARFRFFDGLFRRRFQLAQEREEKLVEIVFPDSLTQAGALPRDTKKKILQGSFERLRATIY
jgi:hypothetical protein